MCSTIAHRISDNGLSEGQVAAFAMAVFFRGMTTAERVAMTLGLVNSGVTLDWSDLGLPGPVIDKHSSGGVGDKVSLMLAPIVAACGGFVPMISGRGLGHTGGTLDKLSAISGYDTQPDVATFREAIALQRALGVPSSELSVDDALEIVPQLDPEGLLAATYCELDGYCSPESVVQWYAQGIDVRHPSTRA